MKGKSILFWGALCAAVSAAPLDVPQLSPQALDALRVLRERGIVRGYEDGTLKGDRVASRYEVALQIARLLENLETVQRQFASREDREALQVLTQELGKELGALQIRVKNLEEMTDQLDKRISERERIRFYGRLEARVIAQAFHNTGEVDNDSGRRGAGKPGVPYLNYNDAIGAAPATTLRPQTNGVIPVVDYRRGRALDNGVGFTSRATLGMNIEVSPEIDAQLEFAAFTSQGNQNIDAYWGVSAPYLTNPWTSNSVSDGSNGLNHAQWTKMVFEHLDVVHKPTQTRLRLGAVDKLLMDRFVYRGQPNLTITGPATFPGFGVQVTGARPLAQDFNLRWEFFNVIFGETNVFAGTNYRHNVAGVDAELDWTRGAVKFNYADYSDALFENNAPQGLYSITNVPYQTSTGWTPTQWVNPPGYFVNQLNGANRPIAGWYPGRDSAAGLTQGAGNFAPQRQSSFGVSARQEFLIDESKLRLNVDWGHSVYRANRYSDYSSTGNLVRAELSAFPADSNLELGVAYISVDPNYNPALFNAALLGSRFVTNFNFVGRFTLYDNGAYPQNRQGIQLRGRWQFDDSHGALGWRANFYEQTQTSLYDVRSMANSLGVATPTTAVLGFSPGFSDQVFSGFASPYLYGPLSSSAFTDTLQPLENPRGRQQDYGLTFSYRWDDPAVKVDLAYDRSHWYRPTALTAQMGGSQSYVNVATDYLSLNASWKFTQDWTLRGGCEWSKVTGHHDPGGLYNGFAVATGSTSFINLDSLQTVPMLALDWQLSKDTSFSQEFRYYSTTDSATAPAGVSSASRGYSAHPFNWEGPQFISEFKVAF